MSNNLKSVVNFACQRCLQPIFLDEAFNNLGEHTLAELALPINTNPESDLESQISSLDHFVSQFRLTDSQNGSNGFMLISDVGETDALGHQLKVRAELFDILSSNSDIDHPLCDECTDSLLEQMDDQLRLATAEYNEYNAYLKKLESAQDDDTNNIEMLVKELEDLKNEEQRLRAENKALDEEEKAKREAIAVEEQELKRISAEQNNYWHEYSKYKYDYINTEDESKSLECQLAYSQSHLDKLKKTNVFNSTFHIWHSGHFGTINNFRLGRLPSAPVDWLEINAAWGQTLLLLSAMAKKINLTFKRHKLVPHGNHSYIIDIDTNKELPLFGSGGIKFFWEPKFDSGMIAFLECVQQFKEAIDEKEVGDREFVFPYQMGTERLYDGKGGTDGSAGYSVRIQFNSEEHWTKSMKFLLTNLKWGLAWISSQFNENRN